MPFSRATIISLVELFDRPREHAVLTKNLILFGLEDAAPPSLGGLEKREAALITYLVNHPTLKGPRGSELVFELVEYVFENYTKVAPLFSFAASSAPDGAYEKLRRFLQQDGYEFINGNLRRTIPVEIAATAPPDDLVVLLNTFGFVTTRGHLEQARAAHARGEWAAANAQLRTFVESLLDDSARALSATQAADCSSAHARQELLARLDPPFLIPALNEWRIGGAGDFIQGFIRRLHPEGSHPGLSDEADSTFRLHLTLLVSSHLVRRLRVRLGV
jgi:hypothetical protein